MIKKILAVIVVAVMCFTACKKKEVDTLASIKKKQEKINTDLGKYKMVKVDDIVSKDIGVIHGYFREKEAKKVRVQHFGEQSRNFIDYYFDDGMLIYVESEDYIYNQSNTYTQEKARAEGDSNWYDDSKTVLEINKYYFSDNKLIKWTGKTEKDVPSNIADFTQKEPALLSQAIVALKQLKSETEENE